MAMAMAMVNHVNTPNNLKLNVNSKRDCSATVLSRALTLRTLGLFPKSKLEGRTSEP
jgi:hypothetical protein